LKNTGVDEIELKNTCSDKEGNWRNMSKFYGKQGGITSRRSGFVMERSTMFRQELAICATRYAIGRRIPFFMSLDKPPTVMFELYEGGRLHGNFLASTLKEILQEGSWQIRLNGRRPVLGTLPEGKSAKELDASTSSEALLMNIFCHPELKSHSALYKVLGLDEYEKPEFGVTGNVPLANGRTDKGEIDMKLGNVLVMAKLAETDFTKRPKAHAESYRDFEFAFDTNILPQSEEKYYHHQLIRSVLAASEQNARFVLISDARRPDLLHSWWDVMMAVNDTNLRRRCRFVLWQELAQLAPLQLREFLEEKYGIA
jgi:hypothetical protein